MHNHKTDICYLFIKKETLEYPNCKLKTPQECTLDEKLKTTFMSVCSAGKELS